MTSTEYTPAQIRTNHERATKAAAKMNSSMNNDRMKRVTADCQPGLPAVIVVEYRPYNSRSDDDYAVTVRYPTRVDQTIGNPVTYRNQYTGSNTGTICWAVNQAEESRRNKLQGLRDLEQRLEKAREEVARLEQVVAARKVELGMDEPVPGNPADLEAIAAELNTKFSGTVYSARVVLDSRKDDGDTVWRIEYSDAATGQRLPQYDGLCRRTTSGVTYAL